MNRKHLIKRLNEATKGTLRKNYTLKQFYAFYEVYKSKITDNTTDDEVLNMLNEFFKYTSYSCTIDKETKIITLN